MARSLRIQYPGAIYHVMARGQDRAVIFRDDRDRVCFLEKLEEVVEEEGLRLYAFTLMSNHYHLLVCTPRGNLSKAMQRLQSSYSTWFRTRHQFSGHVFGGRYKSPLVGGDDYLLGVSRYIHLNPVRIQSLAKRPVAERKAVLRSYRWSSYLGYMRPRRRVSWVTYEPLLSLMPEASFRYARYVEAGLKGKDEELIGAMKASSKAIGTEEFRRWAEREHRSLVVALGHLEDVAMRREEAALDPEVVAKQVLSLFGLTAIMRGQSVARDLLIVAWRSRCGLSNRDAGRLLGHADGATVGKRWKALCADHGLLEPLQKKCDEMFGNDNCKA